MFLHDGFSFRWEQAKALLAHLLAYVSTHCLINAETGEVKSTQKTPVRFRDLPGGDSYLLNV
jgi:hypothetical protein